MKVIKLGLHFILDLNSFQNGMSQIEIEKKNFKSGFVEGVESESEVGYQVFERSREDTEQGFQESEGLRADSEVDYEGLEGSREEHWGLEGSNEEL